MANNKINIDSKLRSAYPWPPARPSCRPLEWPLDGGGKELVVDQIQQQQAHLLLEVGVFFGGSLQRWLDSAPHLVCVAVDPWTDGEWWPQYATDRGKADFAEQLGKRDGPYNTFLSTMWEYRDRIVPVRDYAENCLPTLHKLGLRPDVIYLDSDKSLTELETVYRLFPDAILTGDDWTWGMEKGYPIREPLRLFARQNGLHIRTRYATWVLSKRPPTGREHLTDLFHGAWGMILAGKKRSRKLLKSLAKQRPPRN